MRNFTLKVLNENLFIHTYLFIFLCHVTQRLSFIAKGRNLKLGKNLNFQFYAMTQAVLSLFKEDT